jgi:AcrR family transcriptional regulator
LPKSTFFNLPKDKQKRILESAKHIFSKNHYRKVTIDALVEAADIPKGSFYQYFINKDDLFMYLFGEIGIEKKQILDEVIEKANKLSFSQLIIEMLARANKFENQDDVMIGLKDKFLKECPQEVKNKILSDLIPTTMEMFSEIISFYVNSGYFRSNFDIKKASFILTSVVINLDKYELDKEDNHGNVLLKIAKILEEGLIN